MRLRLRWRQAGLRLAVVVVTAGAGAALAAAPFLPQWGAAAVAAGGAAGVALVTKRLDERAVAAEGGDGIEATVVRRLDDPVLLGVHPAQVRAGAGGESQLPDFVVRDVFDDVVRRLKQDSFVLVVGESTAGKSRLAYEAMRMALSDFVVLRPAPADPMQFLAAAARRHRRCVIWLDELDLYLGGGGLTAARLATLLSDREPRRVVILATMRVREYDRYSARNRDAAAAEMWRAGRDVLLRAGTPVELARRWSPAEVARAGAAAGDPRILAGIRQADRFGVAEVLAAGPELVEQWRTGWEPGFTLVVRRWLPRLSTAAGWACTALSRSMSSSNCTCRT
jgi:hypothetical protein